MIVHYLRCPIFHIRTIHHPVQSASSRWYQLRELFRCCNQFQGTSLPCNYLMVLAIYTPKIYSLKNKVLGARVTNEIQPEI